MQPERRFFPLSIPNEGTTEVAVTRSPTKPETLGDYVRRWRGDRSLSEIERNSARKGARVAASYINRIENGLIRRPSSERLTAVCNGLGCPLAELLAIASGRPLTKAIAIEERLLSSFRNLPDEQQDDFVRQVRALEKKYADKSGRRAA
jgi:transcriptional regulator with XRE-family HTH domain